MTFHRRTARLCAILACLASAARAQFMPQQPTALQQPQAMMGGGFVQQPLQQQPAMGLGGFSQPLPLQQQFDMAGLPHQAPVGPASSLLPGAPTQPSWTMPPDVKIEYDGRLLQAMKANVIPHDAYTWTPQQIQGRGLCLRAPRVDGARRETRVTYRRLTSFIRHDRRVPRVECCVMNTENDGIGGRSLVEAHVDHMYHRECDHVLKMCRGQVGRRCKCHRSVTAASATDVVGRMQTAVRDALTKASLVWTENCSTPFFSVVFVAVLSLECDSPRVPILCPQFVSI